ncbi:hypothetical protein AAG906_031980 [Vitis piasezkii]
MDSAPVCVKFIGINDSTWAFQFELFLKGKDLWGHIDGMIVEKPSTFEKSQDVGSSPSWAVLDACIMSWLLGSVEPHIVTHLRPHRSAQSMWAYLKKLEHAIAMFQHGSLSIQDYYSAFLTLWHEYADLVTADVPIAALSTIQTIHATTRRDKFLMKLRSEYEFVRSFLPNRSPVPSFDIFFGELLREEQRLSTQAILEQSHGRRGPPMHSKNLQCFYCKEYGHIAATCPKKFCSYCKKKGYIIKECPFQTSVIVPPVATSAAHDSPSCVLAPPHRLLHPKWCNGCNNSTKLVHGLGASNHMTNNSTALCHVRPYVDQSSIQTANGSSLPIAAIGDASSKFTDVFLAPQLSTNLISVGQLVDNNCAVNFSGNGCVVQDQILVWCGIVV